MDRRSTRRHNDGGRRKKENRETPKQREEEANNDELDMDEESAIEPYTMRRKLEKGARENDKGIEYNY